MYGEPWQGGQSMLRRYEANKANLQMLSTPDRGVQRRHPGRHQGQLL